MNPNTTMGSGKNMHAIQNPEERPKRQLVLEEVHDTLKSPDKKKCNSGNLII